MRFLLFTTLTCLISVSVYGQGACNNQTSITYQGYEYDIVEIGDQCWFAENCRHLPWINSGLGESGEEPRYYVYDYSGTDVEAAKATSNYQIYGALYNWPAVMTEDICPSGWQIPTDEEFTELIEFLGGSEIAAYHMKSTSGWMLNEYSLDCETYDVVTLSCLANGNGSNSYGFTALGGGWYHDGGATTNGVESLWLQTFGAWWTSSGLDSEACWSGFCARDWRLGAANDNCYTANSVARNGYSARCVTNLVITPGCTDDNACNYNSDANSEDGTCDYCSCEWYICGCTNTQACNYMSDALYDDESCVLPGDTCDDGNINTTLDIIQENCDCLGEAYIYGCTDLNACNYEEIANTDDGSCYFINDACDDLDFTTDNDTYNDNCECIGECINDSDDDGICDELEIGGCTDSEACNFNSVATDEDGSCEYVSCAGCTNASACNYSFSAILEDGSCIYIGDSCDDLNPLTFEDYVDEDCFCGGIEITTVNELAALQVRIFPNPASNNLTIDLGDLNGVNTTVKLYDSSSKLVFEKQSSSTLLIDVSGYSKGLYTLELSTSDKSLRSQVVIE